MDRRLSISLDSTLADVTTDADVSAWCGPSLMAAPLGEADAIELARVLAALADPVRLRLLSLAAAEREICSCNLEAPLGKSQPTISHHTKVLADAGLLIGERRGRWTWWRVDAVRLAQVRAALGGDPAEPGLQGTAGDRSGNRP